MALSPNWCNGVQDLWLCRDAVRMKRENTSRVISTRHGTKEKMKYNISLIIKVLPKSVQISAVIVSIIMEYAYGTE